MAINFPTSLDTTAQPAATQIVDSARIAKLIQMVEALQAKVGVNSSAVTTSLDYKVANAVSAPNPAAVNGFLGWVFDLSSATAQSNNPSVGVVYAGGMYLPASTVTNVHCYITVGAVTTHFAMALYNSSGTLLSQTADKVADGNVTGLKTYALGTPQAVTAGYYYVALAVAGATPTFLTGNTTTAAIINGQAGTPPIGFRSAQSATAYATTMPSPVGTLSSANRLFWVAAS